MPKRALSSQPGSMFVSVISSDISISKSLRTQAGKERGDDACFRRGHENEVTILGKSVYSEGISNIYCGDDE
jgi:hypothetical protein